MSQRHNLRKRTPPSERFWPKVDKTPGQGPKGTCWVWKGAVAGEYGRFWDGERLVQAHHFAHEEKHGKLPGGVWLDHVECDFKLCIHPDHTQHSNVQLNTRRYYENMTHCKRGHEYTVENTRVWRGTRGCKICISMNGTAHKAGQLMRQMYK